MHVIKKTEVTFECNTIRPF